MPRRKRLRRAFYRRDPRVVAPELLGKLLVLDTDLVSTVVYARHYYGHCPAWIEEAVGGKPYLVMALFHRKYADANRKEEEAIEVAGLDAGAEEHAVPVREAIAVGKIEGTAKNCRSGNLHLEEGQQCLETAARAVWWDSSLVPPHAKTLKKLSRHLP
mgnify:CR=1 FL=1